MIKKTLGNRRASAKVAVKIGSTLSYIILGIIMLSIVYFYVLSIHEIAEFIAFPGLPRLIMIAVLIFPYSYCSILLFRLFEELLLAKEGVFYKFGLNEYLARAVLFVFGWKINRSADYTYDLEKRFPYRLWWKGLDDLEQK